MGNPGSGNYGLGVGWTTAAAAGSYYGADLSMSATETISGSIIGFRGIALAKATTGKTVNNAIGVTGEVYAFSSGAVNNATGGRFRALILNTGTIINAKAVEIFSPYFASGSMTNVYGLFIRNQSGGTSLNYAIYTNTGLVRFGDNVILADGVYVGQVAGPQLTFDDTLNYLEITGCSVIIGGTVADRLFHIEVSDAVTAAITYGQRLTHITSGTAAALFGAGEEHELEGYDGVPKVASEVVTLWAMALARAQTSLRRWTAFSNGSAGPGYAGFGTVRGLSAPSVDIIPNGAGDVARGGRFVYCIYLNTAAAFLSGTIEATPGGGAVDLYNVGADQFTLTVAANGSVSVVRAAGTDSADIAISATWL